MESYVEHVNLNVRNLNEAVKFLITAMPDFQVRNPQRGTGPMNWLHIGTEDTYLTLNEISESSFFKWARKYLFLKHSTGTVFNHIGFAVENVEAVKKRLNAEGYRGGYNKGEVIANEHRKRLYYLDEDGTEYEFVEYLSTDPASRNHYED